MRNLTAAAALAAALLGATACGARVEAPAAAPPPAEPAAETVAADDLENELQALDGTDWVRSYDPARSAGGLNLLLYRRRVPAIVDLNGHVVHSWPQVRATGRIRLDDEGRLTVIGADSRIKEYDWDGSLLWSFDLPGADDLPHHDLIKLRSGAVLVLAVDREARTDYLLEVQRDGTVTWRWRFTDHRKAFAGWNAELANPTHTNSIHELPPNRWHEAGDERFRPGNILVSARNLSTVFIIDKLSGEVVWQHSQELDHQHEATMVPEGEPGEGAILLFDNGLENRHRYRRSLIKAIDPTSGEVLWSFGSPHFFSSVEGTAQALPGGNVAITSSRGGRAFEITPAGRIVWEWVPVYMPIRVERLRPDHCPQLAGLGRPAERPVSPPPEGPYIDRELYQFSVRHEVRREVVADAARDLAPEGDSCRRLVIPPAAFLRAGFGIREAGTGPAAVTGRFQLELRTGQASERLVDAMLSSSGEAWSELRAIPLHRFAYREVELCLEAGPAGGGGGDAARLVWGSPAVSSRTMRPAPPSEGERLSAAERALRERQLAVLGYVE
jgi:hypothetical protein